MLKINCIIKKFVSSRNTLSLSTGYGEYTRCTPVEYVYYKDNFYIITEGIAEVIPMYEEEYEIVLKEKDMIQDSTCISNKMRYRLLFMTILKKNQYTYNKINYIEGG